MLNSKIDIVKKIISISTRLSDCGVINATSTAKEADEYHEYINEESGQKLINTGTIDKYVSLWGKKTLTDKGESFLRPYLDLSASVISPQRRKLFQKKKIIIAKIGLSAEAVFDEKGEFASINTNCIHSFKNEYEPKYITIWLNSSLYHFLFSCFFDGLRMSGGYLLFSSPNLKSTFIKPPNKKESDISMQLYDLLAWVVDEKESLLLSSIANAFVFNLYFPDHMEERELNVLEFVERDINQALQGREFDSLRDTEKENAIEQLYTTWSHPDNEVRNRIKLFAVRSPEILKPILENQ